MKRFDSMVCGNANEAQTQHYSVDHAKAASLRVVSMDPFCSVVINPTSIDDKDGDLAVICIKAGEVDMFVPLTSSGHAITAHLPVKVWQTVTSFTCTCTQDHYVSIELYDWVKDDGN